jgi:hypothetical protein
MPEVLCFDPPSQRGDPSMALNASQVAAVAALLAGSKAPTLVWELNGTRSSPVSTFLGASTNGVCGLPSPIVISEAQIAVGKSFTDIYFVLRKTGTGTGGLSVKFGPANGLSDTDIQPSIGNSFSATDPLEFYMSLRVTYSAGKVFVTGQRRVNGSSSPLSDAKETSVSLTGDNYMNIALNTFSAGTNVDLVSLSVRHFL